MISVSASNVMWGVLFVYVARWVVAQSEAKAVVKDAVKGQPLEMKDIQVGLKKSDVVVLGPFGMFQ